MNQRSATVAVAAFIAVWMCGTACAAPSMLGPTGTLVAPDAEVVGRGAIDLGAHFADGRLPFVGDVDFAAYKGTVGLSDRFELTGALVSVDRRPTADPGAAGLRQASPVALSLDEFVVHAKYQLISRPEHGVNLAIGSMDIFEELLSDNIWYGAISRTVGNAEPGEKLLRATAGLALADGIGGGSDDSEFFASLEAEASDVITVVVDRFGDDFSFGARGSIGSHITVDVASVEAAGDRDLLLGGAFNLSW